MTILVHISRRTGDWLNCPVNLGDAVLVAASRAGSTKVWRNPDGKLYQGRFLASGNVELDELDSIPDALTVRY